MLSNIIHSEAFNIIMAFCFMFVIVIGVSLYVRKMIEIDAKWSNPYELHPDDERAAKASKFNNKWPDPIVYSIHHQNQVARKDNQKSIKDIDFEELQYNSANSKGTK